MYLFQVILDTSRIVGNFAFSTNGWGNESFKIQELMDVTYLA